VGKEWQKEQVWPNDRCCSAVLQANVSQNQLNNKKENSLLVPFATP